MTDAVALQKRRNEEEGNDDERDGGHPLIAGDRHPQPVRRLAAHADELLGRDVGRDQRETDQPPGQTAAGEEVILSSVLAVDLLAPALPEADADDDHHEDHEHDDVDDAYTHDDSL